MFEEMQTEKLISIIQKWNNDYWKTGISNVFDERYDSAVAELTKRLPAHELIHKINTPFVYSVKKINHPEPMLSLNKAYNIDEIIKWAKSISRNAEEKFIVQPKYDGLAGRYANGKLSTRGDGYVGEDVSDKISLIIANVPFHEQIPLSLIRSSENIYGEILITKSEFQKWKGKIKKQDGTDYSNSRNAISGIMGLKDISEIEKHNPILTFVDYNYRKSAPYTVAELSAMWEGMLRTYEKTDYPLDGLVIRLKDKEYFEELGNTEHHPRGAIAFKFANQSAITELLEIEWSFGKNCLTPVAIIKETEINGIKINRATLHNVQNIIENDIQIGDIIELERAGDVIPYVRSSKPGKERRNGIIDKCPSCGADLIRRSVELCCLNESCRGTLLENLYASIKTLGIDELGKPTIQKILDKYEDVNNLIKLLCMELSEFESLPGFGIKSAATVYNNIQNAFTNTPERILASLNIPLVGIGVAKKILLNMSLEELLESPRCRIAETIGVGEERVTSIRKFIKQNMDYIKRYFALFTISKETVKSGRTICFTGKMPLPRKKYEKMAIAAGFCPVDRVDKNLNLLVVSDEAESMSSKQSKAQKYNVEIKKLNQWLKEIEK